MSRMGGLASDLPRWSALTMLFGIASLGLPGMGNFIGEFLVLLGSYPVNEPLTIAAAVGLVTAVMYALIMIQRALHGRAREPRRVQRDLGVRETVIVALFTLAIIWLGVFPQPLFDQAAGGIAHLRQAGAGAPLAAAASPPSSPASSP
jgi:NADH-quinone oxidoreductase subunit M